MIEQLEFDFESSETRLLTYSDIKKCKCGKMPHYTNSKLHDI